MSFCPYSGYQGNIDSSRRSPLVVLYSPGDLPNTAIDFLVRGQLPVWQDSVKDMRGALVM